MPDKCRTYRKNKMKSQKFQEQNTKWRWWFDVFVPLAYCLQKTIPNSTEYSFIWICRVREVIMDNDYIFQYDNCNSHTAQSTIEFSKNPENDVLNWPRSRPGLNILKNAWSMLSNLMCDGPQPRKVKELENRVKEAAVMEKYLSYSDQLVVI